LTFGSLLAAMIAVAALLGTAPAGALPPGGTDTFGVHASVHVTSRLGVETIDFKGTATITRDSPVMDGGVEVSQVELTSMELEGFSFVGALEVTESPTLDSVGELRSNQAGQEFPATLSLDVFLEVNVPANPGGVLPLHNDVILHFVSGDITVWPPDGVDLQLDTPYNVDDDGDGEVDEDSSDDDGDGLYDEDRPGPDPDTPGSGTECPTPLGGPDCDDEEGEDPPANLCPAASKGVDTLCDEDADGLIDEDPGCFPLVNVGGTTMKAGVCIRESTLTLVDAASITPIPSPTVQPSPTRTPTRTPTPFVSPTPTRTRTPTPQPFATGDANCDDIVNAIDSALILQFGANLIPGLDCSEAADANEDGQVNSIDSALILQFVAGLISQLPP
jgi:hypothetical protein